MWWYLGQPTRPVLGGMLASSGQKKSEKITKAIDSRTSLLLWEYCVPHYIAVLTPARPLPSTLPASLLVFSLPSLLWCHIYLKECLFIMEPAKFLTLANLPTPYSAKCILRLREFVYYRICDSRVIVHKVKIGENTQWKHLCILHFTYYLPCILSLLSVVYFQFDFTVAL